MKTKFRKMGLKPWDLLLIGLILVLSFSISGAVSYAYDRLPDDALVIEQNGNLLLELSEDDLRNDGQHSFRFDGGTGTLEVKDGAVRMLPMSQAICPERICSDTGWIKGSLRSIVCLPNQLVVSFTQSSEAGADVISY